MSQSRTYCFTLNNYVEDELVALRKGIQEEEQVRYAIVGKEIGEQGTPHLQGYIAFKKAWRFKRAKSLVGQRAHLEACKGSEEQNYKYCSKDGDFEEFGSRQEKGKRTDLKDLMATVKDGCYDLKRLREEHPEVCAKYPRFVQDYVRDNIPLPSIPSHQLNEWQADLNQKLLHEPDDRKVTFVVDKEGNNGKSWFAKYYCGLHDNAFLMRPGKHADMAYALPLTLRVLFLDCTRKQVEFFPYTFIEELKDGYVSCTKYESCIKRYEKMHVVVLMNQEPDYEALSHDRYDVIKLE